MKWVEVTAKTVEEAKEAALDQLGVDETDAEFEVLEVPKGGLFGRLRSEARVRARVLPTAPRPKVERRRRARSRSPEGSRPSGPRTEKAATPQQSKPASSKGAEMSSEAPAVDGGAVAETFLDGLVEAFGRRSQVQRQELDDDTTEIALEGDGLGLLIGQRGQTLSAVQELTRTVVQRKAPGFSGRVVVDVAGYRRARRDALERFTREVAEQVRATGVARVLEPMPPADRKVVHDTVNTIEGVITTSEGEEPRRHVVIIAE
ncbi:MAG TPA: RNA-binding cell elongation regulator Jag/EloR [Acidimicrobiales bacterium]|nr:RNA-binding cell elongation regulator Jag/EloR [Acidimicrobiales bacterium]